MKKILFIMIIIATLGVIVALFFSYLVNKPSAAATEQIFTISIGEGVNQISSSLSATKLISSTQVFEIYVWLKDKETNFIAGEYHIPAGTSVAELTRLLTTKQRADEIVLQFIEGWTAHDMAAYLMTQGMIESEEEFLELLTAHEWWDQYTWLQQLPADTSLEGFLFPDTYNFYSDASAADVIAKLLSNFDVKFDESMRSEIAGQGRRLYEVVTLASILEKEVKTPDDMKMVAGIFINRMEIGMALQADSTLNYATGGTNPSLTAEELAIDSPYNTYKYKGLPPTPISNPGLNALTAAVYPTANDYFYFLTSPDGETYYGKTLDEHNSNRQYLK